MTENPPPPRNPYGSQPPPSNDPYGGNPPAAGQTPYGSAPPPPPPARTPTAPRPTRSRRQPPPDRRGPARRSRLRFLARLIDGLMFGVLGGLIAAIATAVVARLIGGIIYLGYYVYMESSRGHTLGKKWLKCACTAPRGATPRWTRRSAATRGTCLEILGHPAAGYGSCRARRFAADHRDRRHHQFRPAQARLARQVRQHQRHQGGLSPST